MTKGTNMSFMLFGMYDGKSESSSDAYGNDSERVGWFIGAKPYDDIWTDYMIMGKSVSLDSDFRWSERFLQDFLRKADIWHDFPARGYTLVNAEFKAGDENQRLDLLYIRTDGALLPCELKIGGNCKDAHGQLIRYISDLYFQKIDLDWVKRAHGDFLSKIVDDVANPRHRRKFNQFLEDNAIADPLVRILPRTGVLMDEDFAPQLLKAVRYLNGYCGFTIRLLRMEAFVDEAWSKDSEEFKFRLDFVDVQ
jgi:hypothetical protein